MTSGKQAHILNASSNLLGICFVLLAGLKLTKTTVAGFADEITLFAALNFIMSCVWSYFSLRGGRHSERMERAADVLFMIGMFALFAAVLIFTMTTL